MARAPAGFLLDLLIRQAAFKLFFGFRIHLLIFFQRFGGGDGTFQLLCLRLHFIRLRQFRVRCIRLCPCIGQRCIRLLQCVGRLMHLLRPFLDCFLIICHRVFGAIDVCRPARALHLPRRIVDFAPAAVEPIPLFLLLMQILERLIIALRLRDDPNQFGSAGTAFFLLPIKRQKLIVFIIHQPFQHLDHMRCIAAFAVFQQHRTFGKIGVELDVLHRSANLFIQLILFLFALSVHIAQLFFHLCIQLGIEQLAEQIDAILARGG